MARMIKLRAWNERKNIMAQPCFCEIFSDGSFSAGEKNDYPNTWCSDDEIHLTQYTGKKDKQGQEIYEGDILEGWRKTSPHYRSQPRLAKMIFTVIWDGEMSGFRIQYNMRGSNWQCHLGQDGPYKVLGNIYQHPNLINELKKELEA